MQSSDPIGAGDDSPCPLSSGWDKADLHQGAFCARYYLPQAPGSHKGLRWGRKTSQSLLKYWVICGWGLFIQINAKGLQPYGLIPPCSPWGQGGQGSLSGQGATPWTPPRVISICQLTTAPSGRDSWQLLGSFCISPQLAGKPHWVYKPRGNCPPNFGSLAKHSACNRGCGEIRALLRV